MHYSRVAAAPSQTYSAAAAVLMVELLKGTISLAVAFTRLDAPAPQYPSTASTFCSAWGPRALLYRFRRLGKEVFRSDCWKLSIPAILYVIQNNLQFVAVSNLDAATFQVSYQMKILTTAAFSVLLLRRNLSAMKWAALLCLAIGVGIVQIQSGSSGSSHSAQHDMNAFKGFMAVVAACFTSGLAGVYFEMVLKNSQGDLWVRNVQLSLFSLLPALVPILFTRTAEGAAAHTWFSTDLFANFGPWAWATVAIQVLGGLLTALVIKYADNILKGFATSLSIVISFLASVALFNFHMTVTFILGSTIVLVATWMYNQPDGGNADGAKSNGCRWSWRWHRPTHTSRSSSAVALGATTLSRRASSSSLSSLSSLSSTGPKSSSPNSPVERDAPILPQLLEKNLAKKKQDDPPQFTLFGVAPLSRSTSSRVVSSASSSSSSSSSSSTSIASEQPYVFPVPQTTGTTATTMGHSPAFSIQSIPTTFPSRAPSALSSYPPSRPLSAMGGSPLATTSETLQDHAS